MSIYKDYFENITPEKDNEKFAESIINAEKPKMKISPRKITAAAVAAATAMAVTVTGYASGWDYSAVFGQIFGNRAVNIEGNYVKQATVTKNDFDYLDIEISAIVADKYTVMTVFDITGKNGYEITKNGDITELFKSFWFSIDLLGPYDNDMYSVLTRVHEIYTDDNFTRISVCLNTDNNLLDKKINVEVREKYEEKAKWKAYFTVDNVGEEKEYTINKVFNISSDLYGETNAIINKIMITPLNIYIDGIYSNEFKTIASKTMYALTVDEKKIDINPLGGSGIVNSETGIMESKAQFGFKEPINPEDITAVVIGGTVIELK